MEWLKLFFNFVVKSVRVAVRGDRSYYAWIGLLLVVIAVGVGAYGNQALNGLVTSNMRDQVSWGFYIGNFAFLVGIAAAAVVLVVPAYVYNWGPIKEIVLVGELLSVAAIIMCMLFVTVDLGNPQRIWHLMPVLGTPNFPHSLLMWDILVLNSYFVINYVIVTYILFMTFTGRKYKTAFIMPLIFLSIPFAIGIHSVTAFLFMGVKSRPFWHTAILAPRFISSAFTAGPALLLVIFQLMRRVGRFPISNDGLFKIGELLAYAMAVNLFFLGVEVFTEFYAQTQHVVHAHFQWFGLHGMTSIAVYTWLALIANVVACIIFMVPVLRHRLAILNVGCALAFFGIYIEKGMGLLLPGMTPDAMGEVYAYDPSLNEVLVGMGVWGIGALLFTLMVKIAMAINVGEMRYRES
ncbi:MAG: polysulfide reductase NrfD [Deltaproteobacteria bacterium]|nr:polysulfide reductase NrfD [Deltaproteobacteria bacterium]